VPAGQQIYMTKFGRKVDEAPWKGQPRAKRVLKKMGFRFRTTVRLYDKIGLRFAGLRCTRVMALFPSCYLLNRLHTRVCLCNCRQIAARVRKPLRTQNPHQLIFKRITRACTAHCRETTGEKSHWGHCNQR